MLINLVKKIGFAWWLIFASSCQTSPKPTTEEFKQDFSEEEKSLENEEMSDEEESQRAENADEEDEDENLNIKNKNKKQKIEIQPAKTEVNPKDPEEVFNLKQFQDYYARRETGLAQGVYKTKNDYVKVYNKPSLEGSIINFLRKNTFVHVEEKIGEDWIRISSQQYIMIRDLTKGP
jgi:hypothetical protein